MNPSQTQFWSVPSSELLQQLQTTAQGLMSDEVQQRLLRYGSNLLKPKKKSDALTLLFAQFKSPISLILIFGSSGFGVGREGCSEITKFRLPLRQAQGRL